WDEYEEGKNRFKGYTIWIPDDELIERASELFYQIKNMLNTNSVRVEIDETVGKHGRWSDNLPGGKADYPPFQIRPKGSGQSVFVTLPTGLEIKKKALYINKEYIRKIVGLNQ
ncbi:DNA mismatch repair protein MutH, partial [Bacillus sp. OA1]|nr:DNA mismatch repair protein MutH [Bacillus sp. OA1]